MVLLQRQFVIAVWKAKHNNRVYVKREESEINAIEMYKRERKREKEGDLELLFNKPSD